MSEIDFYKPKEVAWLGVDPAGTRGAPGHDLIKVERVLDFGVEKVASMRRKTIEVYGRDGFVLQSEDSYPPVKREVVLHVTDKAVIRPLLSDMELDFYFYDKNEFRRGIVLEPGSTWSMGILGLQLAILLLLVLLHFQSPSWFVDLALFVFVLPPFPGLHKPRLIMCAVCALTQVYLAPPF